MRRRSNNMDKNSTEYIHHDKGFPKGKLKPGNRVGFEFEDFFIRDRLRRTNTPKFPKGKLKPGNRVGFEFVDFFIRDRLRRSPKVIEKENEDADTGIIIHLSAKSFSENFNPIAELLFTFLPYYLSVYGEYKLSNKVQQLYKDSEYLEEVVSEAKSSLINNYEVDENKKVIKSLDNLHYGNSINIDNITYVVRMIERFVKGEAESYEIELVKHFKNIYDFDEEEQDEVPENEISTVINDYSQYIRDKELRKIIYNSIVGKEESDEEGEEGEGSKEEKTKKGSKKPSSKKKDSQKKPKKESKKSSRDAIERQNEEKEELEDLTQQLFGKNNPSQEEIKEASEEYPDLFEKWNKKKNKVRKISKGLLENYWEENELDKVDAEEVKSICKELGIENPIPNGFKGQVSLDKGGSFTFYTVYGEELDTKLRTDRVTMNKNYEEGSGKYYLKYKAFGNKSNEPNKVYTVEAAKNRSKKIFSKVRQIESNIEDVHDNVNSVLEEIGNVDTKDIFKKPGKKKKSWQLGDKELNRYFSAILFKLSNETGNRIGGDKEAKEKRGTIGLANLKGKNLNIYDEDGEEIEIEDVDLEEDSMEGIVDNIQSIQLNYKSKNGKIIDDIIKDRELIRKLVPLKLMRDSEDEYIFSNEQGNNPESPIKPQTVLEYWREEFGYPEEATIHQIRNYLATREFGAVLHNAEENADEWTDKEITDYYEQSIDEIAEYLDNTRKNVESHYVDPSLIRQYFTNTGVEPPDDTKKRLEKLGEWGEEEEEIVEEKQKERNKEDEDEDEEQESESKRSRNKKKKKKTK